MSAPIKELGTLPSTGTLENRRPRFSPALALVIAVIVLAVAYLAYSAAQAGAVYYLTVGELAEEAAELSGRAVRVQGRIDDGSIVQDDTRLWIRFTLTDGQERFPVSYGSVPPDLLGYSDEQKYQEVVVEGHLRNGVLEASNLLVQHGPEFQSVDDLAN